MNAQHNRVGEKGGQALCQALTHNTSLRFVDLSHNPIGPSVVDSLESLVDTSAERGSQLIRVSVEFCTGNSTAR